MYTREKKLKKFVEKWNRRNMKIQEREIKKLKDKNE